MQMIRISVTLLLVFLLTVCSYAQGTLETVITLKRQGTLIELLTAIENQTQLHFSFDAKNIRTDMQVNLSLDKMSVKKILEHLRREHQLAYQEQENVIILKKNLKKNESVKNLSGVIQDESTGELLPGVQITLVRLNQGVASNAYGFYSLSSPTNSNELIRVQSLGYSTKEFSFNFARDSTAVLSLLPSSTILGEVTIQASAVGSTEIEPSAGAFVMNADEIKSIATLGGEPDPLKALQFLPGVISGVEGTTSLSVRGGSNDQNLFLLDEAPVYNPAHALSFFSIFNSDALQTITLHKSEIPVSYGGRLSSIVNVRSREGNRNKLSFTGAIGTIASRLSVEGPLSKKNKKISFIASGRYSYAGLIVNGISFFSSKNVIGFYDLNVKVNYRKDDRNHFYVAAYRGHDNFQYSYITTGYSLSWGNSTATFRWNHIHTNRLFSNTTAVYSNYEYQYRILNNTRYFLWEANLQEFDIKQDYDFYLNNNNHLIFGGGIEGHWIKPGEVRPRSKTSVTKTITLDQQRPLGTYLYLGNVQTIATKLTLKYGLRYSNFILFGPTTRYIFEGDNETPSDSTLYGDGEIEKIYHRLEPRISVNYLIRENSFTFSYDRTTQYFHLLANSSVGLPTDVWLPSGGKIKPQQADIYALTFQRPVGEKLKGSVSLFHKRFNHITDFRDNAKLFVNRYVESQLLQGTGTAYGAEFFLQKTMGKFTGMVSYTLSKAYHRIEGVNDNEKYSPRYNKMHNASATAKIEFSKHWEVGMNYAYTTGGAMTMPTGNFVFDGVVLSTYTTRNSYRLPDYHRMDISVRFTPKKNENRKLKSYWALDIYNVYARKNPLSVFSQPESDVGLSTRISAIYLFRIFPSISYNFKF